MDKNFAYQVIVIYYEHCYLFLKLVEVSLNTTNFLFTELDPPIADFLKIIQTYSPKTNQKTKKEVLHYGITVTNILILIQKDVLIHLDNKTFIWA